MTPPKWQLIRGGRYYEPSPIKPLKQTKPVAPGGGSLFDPVPPSPVGRSLFGEEVEREFACELMQADGEVKS